MGRDEGIASGRFSSLIELTIDLPSLDEALSIIKAPDIDLNDSRLRSVIDAIIDGLNDSSKSIECSKALVDFYESHPEDPIQMEIMIRITLAEKSPIGEDIVDILLSDQTEGSLSRDLDEIDTQHIKELVKTDPGDRPQLLLNQIREMENRANSTQLPFSPLENRPVDSVWIRETYSAQQLSESKPTPGEGQDPNLLKNHLKDLAKKKHPGFIEELSSQMQRNPDFGRQIGNLIRNDEEFRHEMTKAVIHTMTQNSENPNVIHNFLSYSHQIGEDTVIPSMSDEQKTLYIPRLMGNNPMDQLDDLLVRIESGELMTLNTLAQEGPVAVPMLWNIRFGHKIRKRGKS
jgi:hypothetical protein